MILAWLLNNPFHPFVNFNIFLLFVRVVLLVAASVWTVLCIKIFLAALQLERASREAVLQLSEQLVSVLSIISPFENCKNLKFFFFFFFFYQKRRHLCMHFKFVYFARSLDV